MHHKKWLVIFLIVLILGIAGYLVIRKSRILLVSTKENVPERVYSWKDDPKVLMAMEEVRAYLASNIGISADDIQIKFAGTEPDHLLIDAYHGNDQDSSRSVTYNLFRGIPVSIDSGEVVGAGRLGSCVFARATSSDAVIRMAQAAGMREVKNISLFFAVFDSESVCYWQASGLTKDGKMCAINASDYGVGCEVAVPPA